MNLLQKINKCGYTKKDNYPNLPETPRLQRTSWLGRLLYKDGIPIWKVEALGIEKDRWGQIKDPRWYGTVRFAWNFSLYAFYFHLVMYLSDGHASDYGQQQAWALAATIFTSFFWMLLQTRIGEIQDDSYYYGKPRGIIVKKTPKDVRFNNYMDFHLRDFLVKMIYPIGYVIIAWILNGGTYFV